MPGPSDEALLASAADGDSAAYGAFVQRYQRPVLAFIQRFLGRSANAVADDLAQDVFLRAWRAAPDYNPRARAITWLFRIATNACLNHRRDSRLRPTTGIDFDASHESAPPQGLLADERAERVRSAVAALPERQRAALLLSHFDQLSYAEISDVLGISVSAVESLLVRARVSLRESLSDLDLPKGNPGSRVEPDRSC